ncbi:MAG: ParB/RepB/Spo0J family partition protein [Desulfobulbaceae bacterium]|nr:ParB/RepB/Spo0J family partition protein [Desulfobulbaceae bacterium]
MFEKIKVAAIGNGNHPRKNMGDMKSLVMSISNSGMLEPVTVNQGEDGLYTIIDGARRLDVAKKLGWDEVSCLVMKLSAADASVHTYVVNSEREGLNPMDEARYIKFMQEEFGFTLRELEVKGCGTPASLSQKLKLLSLPESVQESISKGELTPAHGRELCRLPSAKEQERMAKQAVDFDLTVTKTKTRISKYIQKCEAKTESKPAAPVPAGDIPGVYMKDSRNMSEIGKETVALVVSSPPYNFGMEFEEGVPFEVHLEETKDVLKEVARVVMPGGTIALNIADIHNFKGGKKPNDPTQIKLMGHWYQSQLGKYGIDLIDIIIWEKNLAWRKHPEKSLTENTTHISYKTMKNFEPVYIFRKRGERELPPEDIIQQSLLTNNEWMTWANSVWKIHSPAEQNDHPSTYPEELCHRLIKMYSYEGDTVLDSWLGSGTTIKVARELDRIGLGYERDQNYKAVIMKKLGVAEPAVKAGEGSMMQYLAEIQKENQQFDLTEVANIDDSTLNSAALGLPPSKITDVSCGVDGAEPFALQAAA